MDALVVRKATRVIPDANMTVLLASDGSPLLLEYNQGPLNIVYLAFDLADSNFILLDAFPMFLANLLRYNGHSYAGLFEGTFCNGDVLRPAGTFVKPVTVACYDHARLLKEWAIAPDLNGKIEFRQTLQPGQYFFQTETATFPPAM